MALIGPNQHFYNTFLRHGQAKKSFYISRINFNFKLQGVFFYFEHVWRGVFPLKIIQFEKVWTFFTSTLNALSSDCIDIMK